MKPPASRGECAARWGGGDVPAHDEVVDKAKLERGKARDDARGQDGAS